MRDLAYWTALRDDYFAAYARRNAGVLTERAFRLACAVAEHETNNGEAWPGTYNFGAVQLRGLTPDETARYAAGELKAGDRFAGNPGGALHVDTHPTPRGPQPYPVWFAAFPSRVDGIDYFLHTLSRLTSGVLGPTRGPAWLCVEATPELVATAMLLGCYYEGSHAGMRPCGHRSLPLTVPETKNRDDYATAIQRGMDLLASVLGPLPEYAPAGVGGVHEYGPATETSPVPDVSPVADTIPPVLDPDQTGPQTPPDGAA